MTRSFLPCAAWVLLWTTGSTIASPLRVHKIAGPDDVLPPGTDDIQARYSLNVPSIGPAGSAIFLYEASASDYRVATTTGLNQLTAFPSQGWIAPNFATLLGLNSRGSFAALLDQYHDGDRVAQSLFVGSPASPSAVLSMGDVINFDGNSLEVTRIEPRAFSRSDDRDTAAAVVRTAPSGIYLALIDGAQVQQIVKFFEQAPGFPAGWTLNYYDWFDVDPFLLNQHAEMVFFGHVYGSEPPPSGIVERRAIFAWKDGIASPLAIQGTPLAGIDPPLIPTDIRLDDFNDNGSVLARIQTANTMWHLVEGDTHTGQFRVVAKVGDTVAGTRIYTIAGIGAGVLSSNGTIVFNAGTDNGHVLISDHNGKLQIVVASGTPANNTGDAYELANHPFEFLCINRRGQIAFSTTVRRNGIQLLEGIAGWDPVRGLSVLAVPDTDLVTIEGEVFHPTAVKLGGSNETSTAVGAGGGDTNGRRQLMSDSGEVAFRVIYQDFPEESAILSATITAPAFGDANTDGLCDGRDLSVLLSNFGESVSPAGSGADFNADGIVNGGDLSILLAAFGT